MKPTKKRFSLNDTGLRSKSLSAAGNFGTPLALGCRPWISTFSAPAHRAVTRWISIGTIVFLGVIAQVAGACPLQALAGDEYQILPVEADTTQQLIGQAAPEAAMEKTMITVNDDKNDKEVSLGMGDTLEVRLTTQPGTGYGWQVAEPLPNVLRLLEKTLDLGGGDQVPNAPGAPGTAVFRFAPAGVGTGELRLVYVRPWEKESAPKKSYKLHVRVQ